MRLGEALATADRLRWTENVAYCLVGLGSLAVAAGELDAAGRFLGQADRLVDDVGLKLEDYAEAVRAQIERDLLSRLGGERPEALRVEGRALPLEAVLSQALPALD
jgi:hypothetical protein